MNAKTLTVTGTGDSLFVVPFPPEYSPLLAEVAKFIGSCDVRLTNLETNLTDFEYFGNAYSGGTWLSTRRKYLDDLARFGFNFYGNANNHAMDYGHNGLLSTVAELDRRGLAHAGTGRSLEEAAAPAVLTTADGHKVAVFAIDASMENASRAGRATHDLPARPGVNFLRHSTAYHVSEADLESLRAIAKKTRINFTREQSIATGYMTPDPEGTFHFGALEFTTADVPATKCNAGDKKRLLDAVREAKKTCDYVFMMIHCHDNDGVRVENPPAYYREFAHDAVDAGVSAIFGGGCHRLRGVEVYKNTPIFYSLGDFIYQGPSVEILPADFMEKYSVDIYSTAKEALWARSRGDKVGLHCSKLNYQTFLPRLEYENGKMVGFKLLPVYLNFDRKDDLKGLPVVAEGAEAREICDLLDGLSADFDTRLKLEDGFIVLA